MTRPARTALALAAALTAWGWAARCAGSSEPVSAERLGAHVKALTASGHRLSGSAAGVKAGDYVIAQLRAAGFENVIVQPFAVAQIHREPGDCRVEAGGRTYPVEPLRPNGLALPVTGPEGIEAETVYLADGGWEHFAGKSLE
ncbi:MAG: hypothetical protein ACYS5V_06675, partial [Planctomycetota bacterium]